MGFVFELTVDKGAKRGTTRKNFVFTKEFGQKKNFWVNVLQNAI